jgi:dTDP-4-amino-4,6-dideoxygalactose transaminase
MCRDRGVIVIEDAAQAMVIDYEGRTLGTGGDVGIFSLGRGKTITCGSGGIIVTNSTTVAGALEERYQRLPFPTLLQTLRDIVQLVILMTFIRPCLYWIPMALPWLRLGETIVPRRITLGRLSGMKAGLLRDWQHVLVRSNRVRSDATAYFSRQLRLTPPAGPSHPYLRLPIFVATAREKAALHEQSQARGLGLSVAYSAPLNELRELRGVLDDRRFPSARHVADTLLTLPTHQWLSAGDKRAIVDCVGP